MLPLEGSLDGMAYPEKLTVKEDANKWDMDIR